MFKILARALDRGVIRMAGGFRAGGRREPHHPAEAEKLLNAPGFFSDLPDIAPELVFTSEKDFQFTSPILTRWAENNRVSGKLFRAGVDWKARPSIILLHGWSAELQYRWQFPFLARQLARAGVNAIMFELPYHGQRRPHEPGAIQNFISQDLLHMLEATRQSLADARAVLRWLQAQGSPVVGLWGISLGAWLGGLLICAEPRPQFAVLLTPIANVDQAIGELAFCEAIRGSLKTTSVRLEPLNLFAHRPLIAPENILIVESRYDVFAPVETVESLWQAWGKPEIWRLPHGHISILLSPSILRQIVKWVREVAGRMKRELQVES